MVPYRFPLQAIVLVFLIQYAQCANYIATFPSNVVGGQRVSLCVSFMMLDNPVKITVRCSDPNVFETFSDEIPPNDECIPIDIKDVSTIADKTEFKITIEGHTQDNKFTFKNEKKFNYIKETTYMFIETDKPIYKPGDTVKFRFLSLDKDLRGLKKNISRIEFTDSTSTRVIDTQFEKTAKDNNYFKEQFEFLNSSFHLNDVIRNLGTWNLTFYDSSNKQLASTQFEVNENAPPKFNLNIRAPRTVVGEKGEMNVFLCGRYPNGKIVKGEATLFITEHGKDFTIGPHHVFSCDEPIMLYYPFSWYPKVERFRIRAILKEKGTNVTVESKSIDVTVTDWKFYIRCIQESYKPGLLNSMKLKVYTNEHRPAADISLNVRILLAKNGKVHREGVYKADATGLVTFVYEAPDCNDYQDCDTLTVEAKTAGDDKHQAKFVLTPWYSKKKAYLQIYQSHTKAECGDIEVVFQLKSPVLQYSHIHYRLQTQLNIITASAIDINAPVSTFTLNGKSIKIKRLGTSSTGRTFSLTIPSMNEMWPKFHIVAYYVVEKEIIPAAETVEVGRCLANKVKLSVNKEIAKASSDIKITISGAANSLCLISAVDKSSTYWPKRNKIDKERLFERLVKHQFASDSNEYIDNVECEAQNPFGLRNLPQVITDKDLMGAKLFKNSNLVLMTDLKMKGECLRYANYRISPIDARQNSEYWFDEPEYEPFLPYKPDDLNVLKNHLPDTWLWEPYTLGASGSIQFTRRVVDSITDWKLDLYCLHPESGLGVAEPVTLKVIRPFFSILNIPFSVVKGEKFPVEVQVYSCLDDCVSAEVEIQFDRNIVGTDRRKVQKMCVCPEDKSTVVFQAKAIDFERDKKVPITVKVTGFDDLCLPNNRDWRTHEYTDNKKEYILIEPEGVSNEETRSVFVNFDAPQNTNKTGNLTINLPGNIVKNSTSGFIVTQGYPISDILGNFNKFDKFINASVGNTTENLIELFAPLAFYRSFASQSNWAVKHKDNEITQILTKIRDGLLTKHQSGSYSNFNQQDSKAEIYLTAFVLRSLEKVYSVFLNDDHLSVPAGWLVSQIDSTTKTLPTQATTPKSYTGGLSNENKDVVLPSIVAISLLKVKDRFANQQSQSQLQQDITDTVNDLITEMLKKVNSKTDTYSLAVTLYSLKLLNNPTLLNKTDEIEKTIDARTINQGNFKYWKYNDQSTQLNPNDIETTAYILLSKLYGVQSDADLSPFFPIIKWLNSNWNEKAEITTIQDVLVCLEAMTEFSNIYKKPVDQNITIAYDINGIAEKNTIQINADNLQTIQTQKLSISSLRNDAKSHSLTYYISGQGSVYLQFSLKYNTKSQKSPTDRLPAQVNEFNIRSHVSFGENCNTANIVVEVKPMKGFNPSGATVSLNMPTGWLITEYSYGDNNYKKVTGGGNDKLTHRFNSFSRIGKRIKLAIKQNYVVQNLVPGSITVYDSTSKQTIQPLSIQCKLKKK